MANWLEGLRTKVLGSAPGVYLGAFGKHPGWDDHIEAIGLDSDTLLAAQDIFYVRGIGGVIDAAMWEKKPEEVLPVIAHVFCWNGEADMLIGRLWSSTDGKGRARYPMVAVAHLGVPFSYSLAVRAAQVLSRVEARCRQVTTAEEVRGIFANGLEELRVSLAQPADELGAEPDRAVCSRLAESMGLHRGETFARTLYAVEGKLQVFAHSPKSVSGKIGLKMLESDVPAQQIRLPMGAQDSIHGIAFWQKVIAGATTQKLPLLFLHPEGQSWVDLVMGAPTSKQLYCIRANEAGLPLASSVPYELDADFRQKAGDLLATVSDLPPAPMNDSWGQPDLPPPLPPAT